MRLLRFSAFLFFIQQKKKVREKKGWEKIWLVFLLPLFIAPCSRPPCLLPFPGIWHLCKERQGVITSKKGEGDLLESRIRHAAPEQVACVVKYYLNNILTESDV